MGKQSTELKIQSKREGGKHPLNLLLTADSHEGVTGISVGQSTPITNLPKDPQGDATISFETLTSARLYVGLGSLANPPLPQGDSYFGWIELSKTEPDAVVWINLSNVDLLGLPLALAGTESGGASFTLGYKLPVAGPQEPTIQSKIITQALKGKAQDPAIITTASGQRKILAPTLAPDSYPSFEDYLESLCQAQAPLVIRSDTPSSGSAQTFTGKFQTASAPQDPVVSLTSSAGSNTLEIHKGDFTSAIIYRGDGGSLYYNGKKLPQNRTATNDPTGTAAEQVITNSTFRNIVIGMNEGYFTPAGPNNSTAFGGQVPFATGQGNRYAQILHETSNSYGFPYADSNLKVLITADPTQALTLTVLKDAQAGGYDPHTQGGDNQPNSGAYQFGIGSGSANLGLIKIGGWRYTANKDGAYGGYLPSLPAWTRMTFSGLGPDHYIWIKDGAVSAGSCLSSPGTFNNEVLTWGANLSWVSGEKPPAKPTT